MITTLLKLFYYLGKSTGIVTNTRITHATPAALYAHSPSRYWEDDGKVPAKSRKFCRDITHQLVKEEPGRNINVSLNSLFNPAFKLIRINKSCDKKHTASKYRIHPPNLAILHPHPPIFIFFIYSTFD